MAVILPSGTVGSAPGVPAWDSRGRRKLSTPGLICQACGFVHHFAKREAIEELS